MRFFCGLKYRKLTKRFQEFLARIKKKKLLFPKSLKIENRERRTNLTDSKNIYIYILNRRTVE
jgi:hypothetical protein